MRRHRPLRRCERRRPASIVATYRWAGPSCTERSSSPEAEHGAVVARETAGGGVERGRHEAIQDRHRRANVRLAIAYVFSRGPLQPGNRVSSGWESLPGCSDSQRLHRGREVALMRYAVGACPPLRLDSAGSAGHDNRRPVDGLRRWRANLLPAAPQRSAPALHLAYLSAESRWEPGSTRMWQPPPPPPLLELPLLPQLPPLPHWAAAVAATERFSMVTSRVVSCMPDPFRILAGA